MIGTWTGYYKYNKEAAQKAMGFDRTFFTIVIHSFDGKKFEGTVTDDTATGGMEGQGIISGEIDNRNVSFRKFMPKQTYVLKDGSRKVFDSKHPAIYYSGTVSDNGNNMRGHWKIKAQVLLVFGFIPFPFKPQHGTWSMHLTGN